MSIRRGLVRRPDVRDSSVKARAPAARLKRSYQMRFMYLVKHPGPPGNPTPQLMEAMHKLADREIKAGRMLDNGGLMPGQTRPQRRTAAGTPPVIYRPFVGA